MPSPGSAPELVKHLLVGHRPDLETSAFVHNFPVATVGYPSLVHAAECAAVARS
jgi:hypothetical protein